MPRWAPTIRRHSPAAATCCQHVGRVHAAPDSSGDRRGHEVLDQLDRERSEAGCVGARLAAGGRASGVAGSPPPNPPPPVGPPPPLLQPAPRRVQATDGQRTECDQTGGKMAMDRGNHGGRPAPAMPAIDVTQSLQKEDSGLPRTTTGCTKSAQCTKIAPPERTRRAARGPYNRPRVEPRRLRLARVLVLAAVVGSVVGVAGFTFRYAEGLSYFSTDPKACANCHIMNDQYASWTQGAAPRRRRAASTATCRTTSSASTSPRR